MGCTCAGELLRLKFKHSRQPPNLGDLRPFVPGLIFHHWSKQPYPFLPDSNLMASLKRKAEAMEDEQKADHVSPFIPNFEFFRTELDEHHDRRERIIKASRDITAQSKKM